MVLLAQMVVEYLADTDKLTSGVVAAAKTQKMMQDTAASATSSMSTGLKHVTDSTQELANHARAAGLDVSKLTASQSQAREAAAKLNVAQTQAAQALKKADDTAKSAKASAEQIAVAQSRAGLAAEKARTAEDNLANSMQKVARESKNLSSALEPPAARSAILSRSMDGLKSSVSGAANMARTVAVGAFTALVGVLVAVAAAIASTIPKAMAFDATLRKINALAGVSQEALGGISDEILKMAGKIGKGPQDLADGLYYIASAGFDAKTSMVILEASAKAAAVGMTGTQVVANAVTAALKAFPGMSVAQAMDMMSQTVSQGKLEWDSYANTVGRVTLAASQAKVSFAEVNAAFATLSNTKTADEAATSLNALLATTSHVSELADRARKLGLTFNENAYQSLNFIDKLRYLQTITKGNSEAIYNLLGQEEAMPAITALLTDGSKDYAKALDSITHSAGAANSQFKTTSAGAQAAWDRAKASAEALQIKIGTALLPVVNLFTDKIAPMVGRLADWIEKNHILENAINGVSTAVGNTVSFFQNNQYAMAALVGAGIALAAIFGAIAIAATVAAIAEAAAAWPILLIVGAVAALAAGFKWLYDNSKPFHDFIDQLGAKLQQAGGFIAANFMPAMTALGQIFATIGAFLASTFQPVWDQLVITWQTQLLPAWNQLMAALQPLMPLFQGIAMVIGAVVVIAFGLLIGIIAGVAQGLAGLLQGVIQVFGGIVQIISGAIQIVSGIIAFFYHLSTGQFDKLGADLGTIWSGIVSFFVGIWNVIAGVFTGAFKAIWGLVSGFVSGVIGFFTGLYDKLVGHSIVPDMMAAIVRSFTDLPGKAATAVGGILGTVGKVFTDLKDKAVQWGSNVVNGLADGIKNAAGSVSSAAANVASTVKGWIGWSSPTKYGPGATSDRWAPALMSMMASGIRAGIPGVESAVEDAARSISGLSSRPGVSLGVSGTSVRVSPARSDSSSRDSKSQGPLHLHLWMDSREIGSGVAPHVSEWQKNELHVQAGVK